MSATNLNRLAMVLAFAGIFVAGFLSLAAAMRVDVPCGFAGGCADVAAHASSKWFNYPVAYFGLAGYLALAFMAGMRSSNGVGNSRGAILAGTLVSGVGTAISGYLIYTSIVVIKATCDWCMASAAIMTASFIVHILMLRASDEADPKAADLDFKLMIGLGVASTVALVGGSSFMKQSTRTIKDFVRTGDLASLAIEDLVPPDAHIMGNPDAPITIIEFADMTCRTCREGFPKVLELINSSKGKYRLVFRHLPLEGEEHRLAWPAAIMAEMAGEKQRFFEFITGVYALSEAPTADDLWELTATLGLKREDIEKRIEDSEDPAMKTLQRDLAVYDKFMTQRGTPTFVVFKGTGQRHVPKGFEDLRTTLTLPEFQ